MKTFISILVIIIILGLLVGITRGIRSTAPATGTPATGGLNIRLQQCPDEMIVDKMPGPGGQKPSYYIFKGERKEISEFDEAWVAANCQVPTQTVY